MSGAKRKTAYQKGVDAEKVAAQYLQDQGFEILCHRYKTKGGEIDLVAAQGEDIVFVEVLSSLAPRPRIENILKSK